jgi:hypothetical protein
MAACISATPVSWPVALAAFVENFQRIQTKHGPHSLSFLSTGQIATEEMADALIPRLESHDLMHLLTGVGADVVSEVELQFTLLGNGKRSLYLLGTVALGLCVYPEHAARFLMGFRRGQRGPRVFDVDGLARLAEPLHQVPQLDAR